MDACPKRGGQATALLCAGVAAAILMAAAGGARAQSALYVDAAASGAGDGTSWADAYTTVQLALDAAAAAATPEVWVAAGLYREALALPTGVALYGGFASTETALGQRDLSRGGLPAWPSIIDASVALDGAPAFHAVSIVNRTTATLDGFAIIGGQADGAGEARYGGGVYCYRSTGVTLANCEIASNTALHGGGVYLYQSQASLTRCVVTINTATLDGGGVYCAMMSSPALSDCAITSNTAGGNGGGLHGYWFSAPTIDRSLFQGNVAAMNGGGARLYGYASPRMTNTIFFDNSAARGGALECALASAPELVNCVIHGNRATFAPGGVFCQSFSSPALVNTILSGNAPLAIAELSYSADPAVTHCLFDGNAGGDYFDDDTATTYTGANAINLYAMGGVFGAANVDGNPRFVDADAGDFHLRDGSRALDRATTEALAPLLDFEGDARPGGDGLADIGVDEAPDAYAPSADNTDPVSFVHDLPAMAPAVVFDVPFVASDNGSGLLRVRLYYRRNHAGGYTQYGGDFTTGPIVFNSASVGGDGYYEFYTRATDRAGNTEGAPAQADAAIHVITAYGGARVYVDRAAGGGESGADWANAFNRLDAALLVARSYPTVQEIWVAHGTYDAAIELLSGVALYGSFATTETSILQRAIASNPTILDASAADDGAPAKHVVTLMGVSGATLDGFTLQGARADGDGFDGFGGGILCVDADRTNTLANCEIRDVSAALGGGGIYYDNSAPLTTNCRVLATSAGGYGGGVYCYWNSTPTIFGCAIVSCVAAAEGPGGADYKQGGGIACATRSNAAITNCVIAGGRADFGGGLFMDQSSPIVVNTIISGNAALRGGGVYGYRDCAPTLTNDTVCGNDASELGGGVFFYGECAAAITNSIFHGNTRYAIYELDFLSDATIRNCLFDANPDGDVYADGVARTGAGAINAFVARARDNVDGDARFDMPAPGRLTSPPSYNPATNRTRLTDAAAWFVGQDLTGRLINPNMGQSLQALIVGQSDTTLDVLGDVRGFVNNGDDYQVIDYHLLFASPAVDRGDNFAPHIPAIDADGRPRIDNYTTDLGVYESGFYTSVLFVDLDAPAGGDGSSWASAIQTIQAGIDAAFAGGIAEVWVAEGTYNEIIQMRTNVAFYGGFAGDESRPYQRNVAAHPTIIDGQGAGRVVTLPPGLRNSRIDGFTITGGHLPSPTGDIHGGGIYCQGMDDSNTIINCTITNNVIEGTGHFGGGIYCRNSSPRIINCTITHNYSRRGSGVYSNQNSAPLIMNCRIQYNKAGGPATASGGGGVYCDSSNPTVVNCVISSNTVQWDGPDRGTTQLNGSGGGVRCVNGSAPLIVNSVIADNNKIEPGNRNWGGGIHYTESSPLVINTVFERNGVYAVYKDDAVGAGVFVNCLFYNNSPADYYDNASAVAYTGAAQLNTAPGVSGALDGNPQFVDTAGYDFHLRYGSPCIDRGSQLNAPSSDFDGAPRPVDIASLGADGTGREFDIGAFELQNLPGVVVTPKFVDFGSWNVGDGPTTSRSVTIANNGYIDLHFTGAGITLTGVQAGEFGFAATPSIATLAPGESRVVYLVFDPTSEGLKAASLRIATDDTDEPVVLVSLYGNGLIPPLMAGMARADADPTNAALVGYEVVFNRAVRGVDASDFIVTTTGGLVGARVAAVVGGPAAYVVVVDTGAGDGALGLALVDDNTITDAFGVPLGGVSYGDRAAGEPYGVDKTAPRSAVNAAALGGAEARMAFAVPYTAVDAGEGFEEGGDGGFASGVASVRLFFSKRDAAGQFGPYVEYRRGQPWPAGETIVFDAGATGPGVYRLYTVAADRAGNEEAAPAAADATIAVNAGANAKIWWVD